MPDRSHVCAPFVERTRADPDGLFAVLVSRGDERALTNLWLLGGAWKSAGDCWTPGSGRAIWS